MTQTPKASWAKLSCGKRATVGKILKTILFVMAIEGAGSAILTFAFKAFVAWDHYMTNKEVRRSPRDNSAVSDAGAPLQNLKISSDG
jgi:hypothetical protein